MSRKRKAVEVPERNTHKKSKTVAVKQEHDSFLSSFVPEWSDRLIAWTFALELATDCMSSIAKATPSDECKQQQQQHSIAGDSKDASSSMQNTACLTGTLCLDQELSLDELDLLEVLFGGTRDKAKMLHLTSPISHHEFSARFTRSDTIVVHVNHSPRLSCTLEMLAMLALVCMSTQRCPTIYSLLLKTWRDKSSVESRRQACCALLDWLNARCLVKQPQKNVIWSMDRTAALAATNTQLVDIYNWCEDHVDAGQVDGRVSVKLADWEARVLCVHPFDDRKEIYFLKMLRVSMMIGPSEQLPIEWDQDTHSTHVSAWRRVVVTYHQTGKIVVGNTSCAQDAKAAVALLELLAQRAAAAKSRL